MTLGELRKILKDIEGVPDSLPVRVVLKLPEGVVYMQAPDAYLTFDNRKNMYFFELALADDVANQLGLVGMGETSV